MQFLPIIKQQCDAVINITTGGGLGMTLEQRLAAAIAGEAGDGLAQHGLHELRPVPPARTSTTDWKHDWEAEFLEMTRDFIFRNTFKRYRVRSSRA